MKRCKKATSLHSETPVDTNNLSDDELETASGGISILGKFKRPTHTCICVKCGKKFSWGGGGMKPLTCPECHSNGFC